MEAKFKDVDFAIKAYSRVVKRVIDAGVRTDLAYPFPTWPVTLAKARHSPYLVAWLF